MSLGLGPFSTILFPSGVSLYDDHFQVRPLDVIGQTAHFVFTVSLGDSKPATQEWGSKRLPSCLICWWALLAGFQFVT